MTPLPAATRAVGADLDWPRLLQRALSEDGYPRLVFQPVVDLSRGTVAGYESLARFDPAVPATPDVWFHHAALAGVAEELEAKVVTQAMRARDDVPPGSFLTVNLSPHLLAVPAVRRAFESGGDLAGVVVELTEHVDFGSSPDLDAALAWVRRRGALVAMDDAGSGYSGISQLVTVRPDFVKLDRFLVDRVDTDPAKLAAIESLGTLAGRLDAWVIGEGVERPEELEVLARLGIPLGQGWLLGRPAAPWTTVPAAAAAAARAAGARSEAGDTVARILTCPPSLSAREPWEPEGEDDARVRVDADGCPLALLLALRRGTDHLGSREGASFQRVHASSPLWDVAGTAMSRAAARRFDPLVAVDQAGRYAGLVRVDTLLLTAVRRLQPDGGAEHLGVTSVSPAPPTKERS